MARPGFWDDQESARQWVDQLKSLNAVVKPLTETCTIQGSEMKTRAATTPFKKNCLESLDQ